MNLLTNEPKNVLEIENPTTENHTTSYPNYPKLKSLIVELKSTNKKIQFNILKKLKTWV